MSKELDEELESDLDPEMGEGDSVSDKSEAELEGRSAADADDDERENGDADRTSGDPAKEVVGLKKRIAKLTAQRNRSRVAETERDALKARVAAYEARERDREERRRAKEEATPEYQTLAAKRRAVRETIDDAYPGADEFLSEAKSAWEEEKQLRKEAYARDGISYLKSELEDHDLPVDNETLVRYERAVGSELAEDPELLSMYLRPATQKEALQAAFERVRDGIVNPVLKQRGAKEVARIERTRSEVLGGGRNVGAVAQAEEPTFDLKPPKGLNPRQQEAWWSKQTQDYWAKLNSAAEA